jgi:hypothetical protein
LSVFRHFVTYPQNFGGGPGLVWTWPPPPRYSLWDGKASGDLRIKVTVATTGTLGSCPPSVGGWITATRPTYTPRCFLIRQAPTADLLIRVAPSPRSQLFDSALPFR